MSALLCVMEMRGCKHRGSGESRVGIEGIDTKDMSVLSAKRQVNYVK